MLKRLVKLDMCFEHNNSHYYNFFFFIFNSIEILIACLQRKEFE